MNQSPACCYFVPLPPGRAVHQQGCCLLSLTPRFTDLSHIFLLSPAFVFTFPFPPPPHMTSPLFWAVLLSILILLAHVFQGCNRTLWSYYIVFHFLIQNRDGTVCDIHCTHSTGAAASAEVWQYLLDRTHAEQHTTTLQLLVIIKAIYKVKFMLCLYLLLIISDDDMRDKC